MDEVICEMIGIVQIVLDVCKKTKLDGEVLDPQNIFIFVTDILSCSTAYVFLVLLE